MGLALKDPGYHTYGDYLTWPEDTRYELIDGRAYAMAPAPSLGHQDVVGEIYRQVADALEGSPCRTFIAPVDVILPRADEADDGVDTVVQPDVLVVCDGKKIDRRRVRGAPDWVVEVLSKATAAHDHILKRGIYERAGVLEYWLVHPVDRIVTIYRLEQGAYGKPEVSELTGETRVTCLPQITIDWARVTRRL
jgi:Uma2 family endonuclease